MYQPYDLFAYQAYNDPKPDHYASAIPSGVPQPSRPSGFQPPTATPSHPPKQEPPKKEERHASHSVPKREEKKKDSGASEEAKLMVKQLKEANASLNLQLTNSKESADKVVREKDTLIANLRREIDASRSQAGVGQREAAAAVERDWVQRLSSKEQAHKQLLASVRREAEANAQRLTTKQQEYQQVFVQARKDADASTQRLSSKEQENQQLLAQNRDLVDQTETKAAAVAQLKREWAARLSKAEQENSLLLVRFTQLQSDTETGRACLLETNAAQEERITKFRDEAKQHEAEVVKLRDETRNQEAELVKLRDETSKLLDELTLMVEEKDSASQSVKESEQEKRELEERVKELKAESAEFMADINAINLEKKKLLRNIAAVEKELDECRTLCEKRRLRIEELDNEQLPTLNSQIELMSRLDERAQGKVAELEDRLAKLASMLEASRHARDSLEHQLDEAEKREMESRRRVAGESRAGAEDLERLRLELERHQRDHAKYFAAVESEKAALEQRVVESESARRNALDRVSALEESLKGVTEMRDHLQEEYGIVVVTLDREVQEGDDAKAEYKLSLEKLEERITTLEAQVAESEAKQVEAQNGQRAAQEMLDALKEEKRSLMADTEVLELQGQVKSLEEEKAELLVKLEGLGKVIGRHEETLAHHEDELLTKRRIEREVKVLRLELSHELSKGKEELEAEIGNLTNQLRDANERAKDLEDERSYSEARNVAYLEDNKAAAVKASALDTVLREKETEYKKLNDRFLEINGKYMDVVAEREQLTQTIRNLRK